MRNVQVTQLIKVKEVTKTPKKKKDLIEVESFRAGVKLNHKMKLK